MINLLPPSHKQELRGEEQFRLALLCGFLLMAFFVCLSLLLLSIRVYVSGEIQTQQILAESQKKGVLVPLIKEIHQRNADISEVASFYASRTTLSDVITRISDSLPEGVSLSALSYVTVPKSKIVLAGFAPLTEDLLSLRTNLEKEPLFGNFHFPASNWVRATDINFSFDFGI